MRFSHTTMAVLSAAFFLNGCSQKPETAEEAIERTQQEIELEGYSPVNGPAETITALPPGSLAENLVVVGDTMYVSYTQFQQAGPPLGFILKQDLNTGVQTPIPVPAATGMLMGGIELDDNLIFLATYVPQDPQDPNPPSSIVFSMDLSTNAITQISGAVPAGMNGLVVRGDHWYAADTLFGVIYTGSVLGGPATVWLTDPLLAGDSNYVPFSDPCGPPAAFGANGIRRDGRLFDDSIIVTNVTQKTMLRIPVMSDGTAGAIEVMHDLPVMPDDLWPDRCGYYPDTGAFYAANGSHAVFWRNGFTGEDVEIASCPTPTAVIPYDDGLLITCANSPLMSACAYPGDNAQASVIKVPLNWGFRLLCLTQPNCQ